MKLSRGLLRAAFVTVLCLACFGGEPAWLSGLDPGRPASLCEARRRFLAQFPITSPNQAQGLFELWGFYSASIHANQDVFAWSENDLTDGQFQELTAALRTGKRTVLDEVLARMPRVRERVAPYLACGYRIVVDFDDTIMFDGNPLFLRAIEDKIQPPLREYVELYLKQSPLWLDYDLGLAIPLEALRARIRRWERLRHEYRTIAPLTSHLDSALHYMFELYFCGLPNSLPFDDYGQMTADARASYQQFLRLNTASREYKLMASSLAILQRHDWLLNQELIQLYEAHGYSTDALKRELARLHP